MTGDAAHVEAPRPPVNRMVIAILSVLGFSVSLYMWAYSAGLTGPVLCGIGDCEAVQNSEFSRMGGVPVAAFGAGGYLVLLLSALVGLQPGWQTSRKISWLLFGGGFLGLAFSAYLTYLEAFVINAWCQWCVSSAIIMVLAFGASIPELKRGRTWT